MEGRELKSEKVPATGGNHALLTEIRKSVFELE